MYLFLATDGDPHLSMEKPPKDSLWVEVKIDGGFLVLANRYFPIVAKAGMELQKKLREIEFTTDLARRDEL